MTGEVLPIRGSLSDGAQPVEMLVVHPFDPGHEEDLRLRILEAEIYTLDAFFNDATENGFAIPGSSGDKGAVSAPTDEQGLYQTKRQIYYGYGSPELAEYYDTWSDELNEKGARALFGDAIVKNDQLYVSTRRPLRAPPDAVEFTDRCVEYRGKLPNIPDRINLYHWLNDRLDWLDGHTDEEKEVARFAAAVIGDKVIKIEPASRTDHHLEESDWGLRTYTSLENRNLITADN